MQRAIDIHLIDVGAEQPLHLDCGIDLSPFQIAYQTYGELNVDRSNAVLICHALTGDQHVANVHPVTGKTGWWILIAIIPFGFIVLLVFYLQNSEGPNQYGQAPDVAPAM